MEYNILIGKPIEEDKDLFFGPLSGAEDFKLKEDMLFANLLVELGLFSSTSQARKNGWNKNIPEGFTDVIVGKLKTRITILKIIH